MIAYRVFGLNLISDYSFSYRLAKGSGKADVAFFLSNDKIPQFNWPKIKPIYESPYKMENGESVLYIYRLDGYNLARFPRIADFCIWPEKITSCIQDLACRIEMEGDLFGTVFATWLELRGTPAIHSSAVVLKREVVAFLSDNSGGKSTLAATFVQHGSRLFTDDILPVGRSQGVIIGYPGYPQMRMWPDEARHFLGHFEDLKRVHAKYDKRIVPVGPDSFGTFCDRSLPLAAFYLPERKDSKEAYIEIEPVSPRDAVVELVRNSFVSKISEALGLGAMRMNFLVQIAKQVPMRRVKYPSGFQHLDDVRDAIIRDLEALHDQQRT